MHVLARAYYPEVEGKSESDQAVRQGGQDAD